MARLVEVGTPVNDGEREVLRVLRDQLDDSWHVVSNFTVEQGGRSFECDAVAFSTNGYAYLIETKAWTGQITGNDSQWSFPSVATGENLYRPNPVPLVDKKAKVLSDVLKAEEKPLRYVFVAPLVVIASETRPRLSGRCADVTVALSDLVERLALDPREEDDYRRNKVPVDAAERALETVTRSSRPIAPEPFLGNWLLVEQVAVGPTWEIWSARSRLAGANAPQMRLKRYRLDPLLSGEQRTLQADRARRDLEALVNLAGSEGAAPLVADVEEIEDSFVVVTEWPRGDSLASLLEQGPLDPEDAEEVMEALLRALASVHRAGIVHRNLSPASAFYLADGRIVLTDFDYARLPDVRGNITEYIEEELSTDYAPPEVKEDPGKANFASDVWSAARLALDLFGAGEPDSYEPDAVPTAWLPSLERALEARPGVRQPNADVFLDELSGDDGKVDPLFDGFQVHDEINGRWVVKGNGMAEGALARVYRVFDTLSEQYFAAKFARGECAHLFDPADEYRQLVEVPEHPGIVKPELPEQMERFRRGKREYEARTTFLRTRWVEGIRLDRLITERVGPARSTQLVIELSEAVSHLHRHGVLHRDIKPENVIVAAGRPRLVDFNVSKAMEEAGKTAAGTPFYRPPDQPDVEWAPDFEVYSLGVLHCELLAGERLGWRARAWVEGASQLDPHLRAALLKATAPKQAERFDSVSEFQEQLEGALREIEAFTPPLDRAPFPAAPREELDRPNWNPYQARLVGLFSQSRVSNAGTRGLDEFAEWAYVETEIDRELFPAIVKGQYRLVAISGNAGDGKTAFIQTLERRLGGDPESRVERRPERNGATIEYRGRRFVTNWDGSQDEGERDNDDVLLDFFSPFAGAAPSPTESETRVIAINEGRLLDFLARHASRFPWLDRQVRRLFGESESPEADWLALVNLNLRALTVPGEDGHSLTGALLDRFSDKRLWDPCRGCVALEHCYANANASVLRDPVLGPRARERIRQTLEVARLRRRLHITMRDLRSALAYTVAGNRTCDEIVALTEAGEGESLLAGHLYNSLFAASDHLPPPAFDSAAANDRLLTVVGPLDVAKTPGPEDDARLWRLGPAVIEEDPEGVARTDRALLAELKQRIPLSATELANADVQDAIRLFHGSLRRKLFFEREEPAWVEMLPYERLTEFLSLLDGCDDSARDRLASAISRSERLFSDEFADRVAVRLVGEAFSAERSFLTYAADRFELEPLDRSAMAEYVEYRPDTLRFRLRSAPVELEVDVDLFETLVRMLEGFTPSLEELRGTWLNLRIFKDHLASIPSDSLLLTRDDRSFHRLFRPDAEKAVAVEAAS